MKNYQSVIAQDFLCVPATLQMIIQRSVNMDVSQIQIAEHLGVCVPTDYHGSIQNIERTDQISKWGVRIMNDDINRLFKKLNIPLQETYTPSNTLSDFEFNDFVTSLSLTGHDIICGFSYGVLFKERDNIDVGHVAILLECNGEVCSMYDPGPKNYGIKNVALDDLRMAMRVKKDGLWVIKKQEDITNANQ